MKKATFAGFPTFIRIYVSPTGITRLDYRIGMLLLLLSESGKERRIAHGNVGHVYVGIVGRRLRLCKIEN